MNRYGNLLKIYAIGKTDIEWHMQYKIVLQEKNVYIYTYICLYMDQKNVEVQAPNSW